MYEFPPGATAKSIYFFLRDATTGQAKTGLTVASPGARAAVTRSGGSATALALVALATPTSPWVSGGFSEVSAAIQPGAYRLDVPDAANAPGVPFYVATFGADNTLDEGALVLLRNPTNNVGAGALAYQVLVRRSDNNLPLAGASVWISTDQAGTNVVAGASPTDANGLVTFQLDAGSYFLWVQDPGFGGTNPTAITVS